ncbi:MAG: ATP synthase subunit I [Pseudomonadales bacterium]
MPLTYRIVILQLCVAVVASAGLMLMSSRQAVAGLIAGAVCVIPNALFAWQTERQRSAGRLLALGVLRFALTLLLLGIAVAAWQPAALGFFGTLVLAQLMYVAGPMTARGAT